MNLAAEFVRATCVALIVRRVRHKSSWWKAPVTCDDRRQATLARSCWRIRRCLASLQQNETTLPTEHARHCHERCLIYPSIAVYFARSPYLTANHHRTEIQEACPPSRAVLERLRRNSPTTSSYSTLYAQRPAGTISQISVHSSAMDHSLRR